MLISNNGYEPYMAKSKKQKVLDSNDTQINRLFGFMAVVFVAMVGVGFAKQVMNADFYAKKSAARIERSIKSMALRGSILDRNGVPLAVSRHVYIPEFNPKKLNEAIENGEVQVDKLLTAEKYQKLATIFNMPVEEIQAALSDVNSTRKVIDVKLSLTQADEVKALHFPGLRLVEETERVYPAGNQFSHLLGFVNAEGKGEGLEAVHHQYLTGKDGYQAVLRDRFGNVVQFVDSEKNTPKQDGQSLTLSVDSRIQRLAYEALGQAVQKHHAKSGAVVVLDAQTGEILAMTSLPDYNPHYYNTYPQEVLRNYAVSAVADQGSTIKPFIVAKAIDDGKITPETMFNTQPYVVGGVPIRDVHVYPSLTTEGILQKSSNVGTAHIADLYDNKTLYDYYRSVGFGKKTQSGVTGEQALSLLPLEKWTALDKVKISYGYTMPSNLLQVAQGYTIFTTDGHLMPASIYKNNRKINGEQVIRPETAHQMRQMLTSVVEKGGTGTSAAIEGYVVAGKSGTAHKYIEKQGYDNQKYLSSFIGFAPATNPRLIVAVSIDEPEKETGYYGGVVAAPVFQTVMAGSLKYLGVKPSKDAQLATR